MDSRPSRIAVLYSTHMQEATRLAYLMTGERELAEDLAQVAFVRAAGRLAHLRGDDSFGRYLTTSVVNACRGHWRRRKVERRYLDVIRRESQVPSTDPDVGSRVEINDALNGLPPRQRIAVVLRHYADLSEQRTADLMGCSVGTVKTLTSRGLKTLRERIQR